MKISPAGIALIKQFEGFSATPYQCPAGKWTIGYGHVLPSQTSPILGEKMAEKLLLTDLAPVESTINRLVKVRLTQGQFDALCSLVYNIGTGAFAASTLLMLLNARSRNTSKQFLRWIYAGKQPLTGLIRRRQAEKEMFDKSMY